MPASPFVLLTAPLFSQFGVAQPFVISATIDDIANSFARVDAVVPVQFEGQACAISGGVSVSGVLRARWSGECASCLEDASGVVDVDMREIFERHPTEGETYLLGRDSLDAEPMIRDALLLALPVSVRCSPECAGLCSQCGVNRNVSTCACTQDSTDPRWDALPSFHQV